MLEKMQPITALVTQDVREIIFPEPEKMLSPPIIAVDDVSVGYEPEKAGAQPRHAAHRQ